MAGNMISVNKEVVSTESDNFFRQKEMMMDMMQKMETSINNLNTGLVGAAGDSVQSIYPSMKRVFDNSRQLMDDMGAALNKIRENFIDTDRGSTISM